MLGDYAYGSYFFFFYFSFCFPPLCAYSSFTNFSFPVKRSCVKRPNCFHGSPHSRYSRVAWLLPSYPYASFPDSREELQMMIAFKQWRHFFSFFFFLSFAKIQTRLPSAFAVQFSTWIKKTVHVSRPFYYSFFSPSFWNFQTPERIISPALSVLYPNSKRKESEILLVNDKSGDSSL